VNEILEHVEKVKPLFPLLGGLLIWVAFFRAWELGLRNDLSKVRTCFLLGFWSLTVIVGVLLIAIAGGYGGVFGGDPG